LAKAQEEAERARLNRQQQKRTRKEEAARARLDREQDERARTQAGAATPAPRGAGTAEGAPGRQVRGYMIDVTWDGQTLTVLPSNLAARVALLGQDHREGALALAADEIESTELKPANALVNGRITVRTKDGRTYLLHFRRKSNTEFARLYKALPG
jgi:hypothetical protein